MGVLIEGMKMPRPKLAGMAAVYNAYVVVKHNGDAKIIVDNEDKTDSTYSLVSIPPHGRLGDLDELYAHLNEWYLTNNPVFTKEEVLYIRAMLLGISEAPTIIEAEGGNMNNCSDCPYFKDVFGNFVECVKLHRFVDYEYWHNLEVEDCPLKNEPPKEEKS